jgi:hypothetical protein
VSASDGIFADRCVVLASDRILPVLAALRRSALFEMGNTRVIAAVYGPREVIPRSLLISVVPCTCGIGHAHACLWKCSLEGIFIYWSSCDP